MNWNKYFSMMIEWKRLPAYRTEPRVDSFLGFFLMEILEQHQNVKVEGMIPEFPLRLGTINKNPEVSPFSNKSVKVDFFVIGKNGINYLIEFKTDSSSKNKKQNAYLLAAKDISTAELIRGVLELSKASNYKKKYGFLIQLLQKYGLLSESNCYTGKNNKLEIYFIQPSNPDKEKDVIDFDYLSKFLNNKYSFSDFEIEFAKALFTWRND